MLSKHCWKNHLSVWTRPNHLASLNYERLIGEYCFDEVPNIQREFPYLTVGNDLAKSIYEHEQLHAAKINFSAWEIHRHKILVQPDRLGNVYEHQFQLLPDILFVAKRRH